MRSTAFATVAISALLVACGSGSSTQTTAPTPTDAGVTVDTPPAPADVQVTPPTDTGPAPMTYPAGPYGIGIGAIFEPFTLHACNTDQDWRFDGPDFYTSNLTVVSIAAGWCVPCQRESSQIQAQIIDRYRGMGVRFVQILVQNPDRTAITSSFCNTWATRYGITFPELMDPRFVTQPYVPMTAFPGNVIIDRQGRIRWREYGADMSLSSIRNAIDDVLARPNP